MAERAAAALKDNRKFVADWHRHRQDSRLPGAGAAVGGKVIVSTGTKTCRTSSSTATCRRCATLKAPVSIALLKGAPTTSAITTSNAPRDGRFLTKARMPPTSAPSRFAKTTDRRQGRMHDVPRIPGLGMATSTRENCLGQDCPNNAECFVMAARREALAADVVVVNHHLFFADVMLRDEAWRELLPACNTVIFDEAHQLPEVGEPVLRRQRPRRQVTDLARDASGEALASATRR